MSRVVVAFALLIVTVPALDAQVPGELRGRVIDASTARPIAGARVDAASAALVAVSDADGTFLLRGLEPRTHRIHVRALGFRAVVVETVVANGRATVIDVALQPAPLRLERVVIRDEAAAATSVTTFDRATIEASGRRDVGELLGAVPGLVVTQAGGPSAATEVSIRGAASGQTLVVLDGVPMNSVITGAADLSRIALETVERVTVRTGAQSARYGPQALAGVIEIETRRPRREASALLRTGAWSERDAGLTIGTARVTGRWRPAASLAGNGRWVRGDFPYDVPPERGGGRARRANSEVVSRHAVGTFAVENGAASARLRGTWQTLARGLAGSIVQPSATGHQSSARTGVSIDAGDALGAFGWSVLADVTTERVRFTDLTPPFGVPYDDSVRATSLSAHAGATYDVGTATLAAGAEGRRLHVRSSMLAAGAPATQDLVGGWTQLRFTSERLIPRAVLSGEAGVRADRSSLLDGVIVSPRVRAGIARGVASASASVGAGYAPPTLADQFFHEGVLVRPNPVLRPERVRGDVEVRGELRDVRAGPFAIGAGAAVFRADVDGMILWLPDFRFVWSPSNYDVTRRGWETHATVALPRVGLEMHGSVDRTDVRYAGTVLAGQVAYRPRTTASIAAVASRRGLRLEVTNRFIGQRRTVPGSPLNVLDAYWRTDARITASRAHRLLHVDATVAVDNLVDRPAAMLADYPFPVRSWSVALRLRHAGVRAP